MNYQTAFYIAITKCVLGWIIFSLALVSTVVSLVLLAEKQGLQGDVLNAVANDFIKIMALIIR
ncbi:MAG: YniB family protein [Candidatus Arsenophonus phytopathogenicus]